MRPSLDRMARAIQLLGHPEKKYPVIHIAGTNGKGSTCLFISELLAHSGYKVGLTLSPHVYEYRERIQISNALAGKMELIPEGDLVRMHQQVLALLPAELGLTYFEWGVCLALQYFYEQKVDIAVLETGLGGRWDATNICRSLVSGITTIGFDHMDYLGDTKEKILIEKLQIVKPDSDFIFGVHEVGLIALAKKHCKDQGARYHHMVDDASVVDRLVDDEMAGLSCAMAKKIKSTFLGRSIAFSFATGRILETRGFKINTTGFLKSSWFVIPPARMEVIAEEPFILVDGAHNEPGLELLKEYLAVEFAGDYDLVFGCLKNRDFNHLAGLIKSQHQNFWALFDGDHRTTPLENYNNVQREHGGEVVELNEGFRVKLLERQTKRPLVVCGSFYLCSQFVRWYHIPSHKEPL